MRAENPVQAVDLDFRWRDAHDRLYTCRPDGNAFAERWVRTVWEDCLDHLLVLSRRHLEIVLGEYVEHYNRGRPHRRLDLTPPRPVAIAASAETIRRRDLLGGLVHEYELAA